MARRFLQVIVEVPDGCSVEDAKKYIRDELPAAGGQLRPDDPLFHGVQIIGKIRSIRLPQEPLCECGFPECNKALRRQRGCDLKPSEGTGK